MIHIWGAGFMMVPLPEDDFKSQEETEQSDLRKFHDCRSFENVDRSDII